MPPQQPDRLLDLIAQLLDFRAHDLIHSAATIPRGSRHDLAIRPCRCNRLPAAPTAPYNAPTRRSNRRSARMKIYLAGPLFTVAERAFNARLAALLREAGHDVIVPQEAETQNMAARALFEACVAGIDWADVVVANMDGADPDSGTAWECGYAFGKKPTLVFRTDFRAAADAGKAPFNLMLSESAARCLDLAFT